MQSCEPGQVFVLVCGCKANEHEHGHRYSRIADRVRRESDLERGTRGIWRNGLICELMDAPNFLCVVGGLDLRWRDGDESDHGTRK